MFAAENGLKGDPRLKAISDAIRVVPHFPKPGIMFQDITTLLLDHKAFKDTVDIFIDRYKDMDISVVAGVEARGFLFGPPIALAIGAKFVPLRKPRKLPGDVICEAYELEYGKDCLEMHVGAVEPGERVIVIDDLVATGGTLSAAIRLLERVGAEVIECACVIGLPEVKVIVFGATRKLFLERSMPGLWNFQCAGKCWSSFENSRIRTHTHVVCCADRQSRRSAATAK